MAPVTEVACIKSAPISLTITAKLAEGSPLDDIKDETIGPGSIEGICCDTTGADVEPIMGDDDNGGTQWKFR